eukprot:3760428-Amphidinium_carterae.1
MVMDVHNPVAAITDPKVPACMKNQVATDSALPSVPPGDAIGAAAKNVFDASYPFLKDVDWLSDACTKPQADGNLLRAAAQPHQKTIGSIDAKGVTLTADYEAADAALCVTQGTHDRMNAPFVPEVQQLLSMVFACLGQNVLDQGRPKKWARAPQS